MFDYFEKKYRTLKGDFVGFVCEGVRKGAIDLGKLHR